METVGSYIDNFFLSSIRPVADCLLETVIYCVTSSPSPWQHWYDAYINGRAQITSISFPLSQMYSPSQCSRRIKMRKRIEPSLTFCFYNEEWLSLFFLCCGGEGRLALLNQHLTPSMIILSLMKVEWRCCHPSFPSRLWPCCRKYDPSTQLGVVVRMSSSVPRPPVQLWMHLIDIGGQNFPLLWYPDFSHGSCSLELSPGRKQKRFLFLCFLLGNQTQKFQLTFFDFHHHCFHLKEESNGELIDCVSLPVELFNQRPSWMKISAACNSWAGGSWRWQYPLAPADCGLCSSHYMYVLQAADWIGYCVNSFYLFLQLRGEYLLGEVKTFDHWMLSVTRSRLADQYTTFVCQEKKFLYSST